MVKENSYIVIQAFMVNELNLKGNELLVYAIIWGFSQDGESEFTGSLNYLADWCNCSRQTVIATLQSLLEKKLIMKNVEYRNNIRFCTYSVVKKTDGWSKNLTGGSQNSLQGWSKNLTGGSQNSLPNNINNNIYNKLNDNIGVTTTDRPKEKRKPFQKPTVEKLAEYCKERAIGGNNVTQMLPKCYTEIEKEKEIDIELEKEKEKGQSTTPAQNRKSSHFQKPTVQEVNEYIQEQGYSVNAERFFDYYESKGWMVGKCQMKDWRAAVRNWERMDKERNAQRKAPEKRRAEGHTDADYIRDFEGLDEF